MWRFLNIVTFVGMISSTGNGAKVVLHHFTHFSHGLNDFWLRNWQITYRTRLIICSYSLSNCEITHDVTLGRLRTSGELPLNAHVVYGSATKHVRCMATRLKYAIYRILHHVWSNIEVGQRVDMSKLLCFSISRTFFFHTSPLHQYKISIVWNMQSTACYITSNLEGGQRVDVSKLLCFSISRTSFNTLPWLCHHTNTKYQLY